MAKADVAGLMEKRQQLERRLAASSEHTAKLEEQRKSLLVGGLTGDAGAQERLQQVNSEIEVATRAASDMSDAIAQIDGQIENLQAAAKTAAREQQIEALRALLQARINDKREERVVALMRKLESELSQMESSTNEIALGLRAFDPPLEGAASGLLERERYPVLNIRAHGLRAIGDFEQYASFAPGILANILRGLDRVRVEEEVAAGAGA